MLQEKTEGEHSPMNRVQTSREKAQSLFPACLFLWDRLAEDCLQVLLHGGDRLEVELLLEDLEDGFLHEGGKGGPDPHVLHPEIQEAVISFPYCSKGQNRFLFFSTTWR